MPCWQLPEHYDLTQMQRPQLTFLLRITGLAWRHPQPSTPSIAMGNAAPAVSNPVSLSGTGIPLQTLPGKAASSTSLVEVGHKSRSKLSCSLVHKRSFREFTIGTLDVNPLFETYLPINGGLDLLGIMGYLHTINQQFKQAITEPRREFLPFTIQVLQKMSHPVKVNQGYRLGSRSLLHSQKLCLDLLDLAMVALLHIRVRGTQIVFEVDRRLLSWTSSRFRRICSSSATSVRFCTSSRTAVA